MKHLEDKIGAWVIRWRWPIIVLTLICVAIIASGGEKLKFTNDYRVFFGKDNPQMLAFEKLEQTYNKNDNLLFVIVPKDGNIFSKKTLSVIHALTEQAWQMPYSTRVDSIANFQHSYAVGEDDLVVEDLILNPDSLTPEDISRIKKVALNEPNLVNNIISPNGHVSGVNVTVYFPGKNEETETPEVVKFARDLAKQIEQDHPDIDIRLTGAVMIDNAFGESSRNDIKNLIPLSFLAMIIMLAVLTRFLAGTFATVLVIAFSILTGMGMGGHLGFPLTSPAVSAPIIILTIAIASAVHILMILRQQLRAGMTRHEAISESLRINLQPIFLTSLTTAIGFLSLNFSDSPPFRDLGNFTAMGVVGSFFYTILFMPALLSLLPIRVKPIRAKPNATQPTLPMQYFADWLIRNRQLLLYSTGAVVIVLIAMIPKNELNDVFTKYFSERVEFRQDNDFTVANLTGFDYIQYSFESGETEGIADPEYLLALANFTEWWRQQSETRHVNSLVDTMRRLNKNMHGDDEAWYKIPEQRELAAQYLLLYEMSLPYGLDLNNQINIDKSATRLSVVLGNMSTNELLALEQRAKTWLLENSPRYNDFDGSGTSMRFAHIGKRNVNSMLIGTTLALIGISLILIIAFRSIKIGLLSLIPNLVPVGMGFGIWALAVGQVGLSLSVVMGMTLGIIVDDTIHLLSKYLRARRENSANTFAAVRYSLMTVGPALVVTSAILIVGFLILTLSDFYLNSSMGLLTAIVIAMALIADFLFFLPLLMRIEENDNDTLTHTTTDQPANTY